MSFLKMFAIKVDCFSGIFAGCGMHPRAEFAFAKIPYLLCRRLVQNIELIKDSRGCAGMCLSLEQVRSWRILPLAVF